MPPVETAWRVASEMVGQETDTFLGREGNPLWRRTDTGRPMRDLNVVIIIMEGMAGRPVGVLGHGESQTPELDALAEQGAFWARTYAVGDRTCRGLIGIVCGHPDLEARSIMKRSRAQGNVLTLAQILKGRGYETMFIFGGNPDFDNMKGFLGAGGVDRFIDRDDMDPDQPFNVWGAHDEGIFKKVNETFVAMGEQRFFAIVKTVSNHEPYDVPAGRTDLLPTDTELNRRLNAYRYADWAIGDYFRQAAQEDYFERTLFVLVPDQERTQSGRDLLDVLGYHVPCLFYAPGIIEPQRIEAVASHTDISPTILSVLGGVYDHCFLGRDMLAVEDEGFAFFRNDKRVALVFGDRALIQAPGLDPFLVDVTPQGLVDVPADQIDAEEVERQRLRMLSYYQAARQLYFNDTYNLPADEGQSPADR
jgi:phosphoglycerol transferase MdoB-like AlkP superfamily enzyme